MAANGTSHELNGSAVQDSASSAQVASAASSGGSKQADPSEVGWLFVPQYYMLVNQDPQRLHRFYTKKSTLIHGKEQEDTKPCFGQQAIHQKIMSLGFQDCKVFVSSVDSQASANGGIVIQVLGEMSNKDGPWRKFAQTFFLAEQPNGYFVLNDIFRYLKEEDETEEEAQEIDEAINEEIAEADKEGRMVHHQGDVTQALQAASDERYIPSSQASNAALPPPAQPSQGADHAAAVSPAAHNSQDSSNADVNNVAEQMAESTLQEAPEEVPEGSESAPAGESATNGSATHTEPIASAPAPAQKQAQTQEARAAPQAQPAAAAAAPAKPKTWASLAASTAAAKPAPAPRQAAPAPRPPPATTAAAPAAGATAARPGAPPAAPLGRPHRGDDEASVFVKNVNAERVKPEALKKALAAYGTVLNLHAIPQKACAFADFATSEDARRAITASQEMGGLSIDGWRVSVEEKRKERPNPGFGRGGPNERGAYRGGPGGRGGRGRGQ